MTRIVIRGVTFLVAVLCLTGTVPVGVVAVPTDDVGGPAASAPAPAELRQTAAASTEKQVLEHVYIDLETDEVYRLGGTPDLSALPDGTYLEVRLVDAGDEVLKETRRVEIAAGERRPLAGSSLELAVLHDHTSYEASYDPGSTVDLWIGAADGSGPVGGIDVTVRVTRPDGTEETFSRTLGPDGNAVLAYDTSGKGTGQYDVVVETADGTSQWGGFVVGTQVADIVPSLGDTTVLGREVSAAVLVTENASPVSDVTVPVTIERPDGSTTTRTVTSDEDGFGSFQFTPTQAGAYVLESSTFHGYAEIEVGRYAANVRVNGAASWYDVAPGTTVSIAGQVQGQSTAAAQLPLEVQLVKDPYGEGTVVATRSVTTDSTGTFYTEWQVPSDAPDGTSYEVQYTTDGGASVAGYNPHIDVVTGSTDSAETGVLDVEVDSDQEYVRPGDTVELTVDADVYDGQWSPYAGETLTIRPAVHGDELAIDSFAVQTDSTGEATVSYTVPEVPDGTRPQFVADADFSGHFGSDGHLQVQRYALDQGWDGGPPGGSATYQISVTDVETGEPVQGYSMMVAAERSERRASVYATDTARTDAAGDATVTAAIPGDASGEHHFDTFGRYEGMNSYPILSVDGFDAQLTGLDGYQYAPGETLTLSYDGPPGTTAVVGVRTWDDYGPPVEETKQLDPGEQFTFTVPADAPDETYYHVSGFAANADGDVVDFHRGLQVGGTTQDSPPTADFTYSPANPTVSDTVTFDAGPSTDEGSITAYAWDVDGDGDQDATGRTVSHQFTAAGAHEVTLSVTDDSGAVDSATQTVYVVDPAGGPGDVTGNGAPAADLDGDGYYEDVTGDGSFNIIDVGAFLQKRGSDAVQANVDAFDFTGDGTVNIIDVGKLLAMSQS